MAQRIWLFLFLLTLAIQAWAVTLQDSLTIWSVVTGSTLVLAILVWSWYRDYRNQRDLARLVDDLEAQNQLFHQVLHSSPIGILIQDRERHVLHQNEALSRILGLSPQAIREHDTPLRELIEDETVREEFYRHYRDMLQQPRYLHEWEMAIRTPMGRRRWISVSGQTLLRQNEVTGILWIVRDVTAEHKARAKLERLTRTDPLTGLLNRRAFMESWDHLTRMAHRYHQPLAMALIDLDHFKQINDRWGHHAGDHVLKWFTEQMRRTFRKSDVIARLGGEEFVVLMPHTSRRNACQALEQLRERLQKAPIGLDDLPGDFAIDFSAGVTEWRRGEPFEFTYHRADMLLYQAKAAGRGRCVTDQRPHRLFEETEDAGRTTA
ncbi:sensor domain-containing diguanylate cyclase [Sulfurivirga sp.]|uniref:GGDEF domain-containing protein n=1 Tax=Sulfurivirga sp. TaxID=2614236 RepID=UPI0025F2CB5B|nr:sensor domain-containing diguanylate cyclase [Sulfurivirga sp.]